MTHVAVVGAGLAGLACAHALARDGRLEVVVLEASARPGGVVGTEHVGRFLLEHGPSSVQAGSESFRALCAELGLAERLVAANEHAQARYVFHAGRLRKLPRGPLGLLASPLLSLRARLRLASEPLRRSPWPRDADPEPTLGAFLEERLGPEPTRLLAGAFVRGVYATELDALGARSAFPRLWELTARHGSIVRGLARRPKSTPQPGPAVPSARLLSFPGGLQELVDALARALGPRLRTHAAVERLGRLQDGRWRLQLRDGELAAERIVLAVPAPAAAELLGRLDPAPRGARDLAGLRSSSLALVHLGFGGGIALPRGLGYLVPPGEPEHASPRALGTLFPSNLFPGRAPDGGVAVTSFYALEALGTMQADLVQRIARADLALSLGLAATPAPEVVHTLTWRNALPEYGVGHDRRVAALTAELAELHHGLLLAGSWVAGVGVEPVLARGRAVAAELLAEVHAR